MARRKAKKKAKKVAPPPLEYHAPRKEPLMALLCAVAGMLFLLTPGVAYLYLGKMRKALVYIFGPWLALLIIGAIIFGIGLFTSGIAFVCYFPLFLILFLFDMAIIYDAYKVAKGEKILPEI
ncbi:MAG: hypothetical protein ABIH83_00820 [Candidatus Micrarchaeota archaeon]